MKKIKNFIILIFSIISCGKNYLEIKQDAKQVVPSKIEDYQALMNNGLMAERTARVLSTLGADEFMIPDVSWKALAGSNLYQKNAYVWANDVYEGGECPDWNEAYQKILYANMALEVEKIKPRPDEQEAWNKVKGTALFHRAWNFYKLAQLFCKTYDKKTAHLELGIPLRLEYDIEQKVGRSTLGETYQRILGDLSEAVSLLPISQENPFLPFRSSAYAMLARIYLQMGEYEKAQEHANLTLQNADYIIDLNDIQFNYLNYFDSPFENQQYGHGNKAVLFMSTFTGTAFAASRFNVNRELYDSYDENDLRKKLFFHPYSGRIVYVGSYYGRGHGSFFSGLSTEEVYLIRSESNARLGNLEEAMSDINHLLNRRYKDGTTPPLFNLDKTGILKFILQERRKELYMRGLRWDDLRRLNKEPEHAITLIRKIGDESFMLEPKDPKWVWPIPINEIEKSNLQQNER